MWHSLSYYLSTACSFILVILGSDFYGKIIFGRKMLVGVALQLFPNVFRSDKYLDSYILDARSSMCRNLCTLSVIFVLF